ncbi:acyltransferase family protein [Silicimonas sp. MF1-12-2]|uniref:acyltransferase family protein n=1 Tax=Silicimonas sp. MF1-12-2 TaxID=3384793 RepID=UPI0039B53A7C
MFLDVGVVVVRDGIGEIRISYLDGLRGIAIAMVLFYHGFFRWRDIEPWEVPSWIEAIASHGAVGVHLFFMISGFVIFLTLERTRDVWTFFARRWLRLFPAMLIASVVSMLLSYVLINRPEGALAPLDLLPGLIFVAPWKIASLTGLHVQSIDGAYWSIYVEVIFYFVVAFSFYLFHDREARFLQGVFITWYFVYLLDLLGYRIEPLVWAFDIIEAQFFGWFLVGILTFKYVSVQRPVYLWTALLYAFGASVAYALSIGSSLGFLIALGIVLIFLLPLWFESVRSLYSQRLLVFLGFVSYPLYLMHQNLVTGAAISLYERGLFALSWALPILPILAAIALAYIIAKIEPVLKNVFRDSFASLFSRYKKIGYGRPEE